MRLGHIRNAFLSYYYLREKEIERVQFVKAHVKGSIIIDSGAHSFFAETDSNRLSASVVQKKGKTKQSPDEYFEKYIAWLKTCYPHFNYFVELDIGELVGQKKVIEWRERLKVAGLFDKCITVYHPAVVTWEEYIRSLDESVSRYVAVEGDRRSRKRLPYTRMIKPAYERKVRVHGFALIKQDILNDSPLYSVDSSSWKAGAKYGAYIGIVGGKFKSVSMREKNGKLFSLASSVKDLAQIYDESKGKQRDKRYEMGLDTYKLMEDYYTQYWERRGIKWD